MIPAQKDMSQVKNLGARRGRKLVIKKKNNVNKILIKSKKLQNDFIIQKKPPMSARANHQQ